MLNYDPQRGIWFCEVLWMSDATLKRYCDAWLHGHDCAEPTLEQRRQAAQYYRQAQYWQGCVDPEVHVIGMPSRHDPRPLFVLLVL